MKILFAILTCNRFFYFKNCLDSILKFSDLSDCGIMVLDCCTQEGGMDSYCKSLKDRIILQRFEDRVPNELYRSMNFAIRYCLDKKIPYINFIQDDYQYLYKNPNVIPSVLELFDKRSDIGQIQTNAVWQRKSVGDYSVERSRKINYAILEGKHLVDTGITRTSIYKKTGLYPSEVISYDQNSSKTHGFGKNRYKVLTNGELWFGNRCRKLGYKRAISFYPNMGMMFDCAYVRKWQRFGRYFPPPNGYYLKPFEESDIKSVARRNKKCKFTYIEQSIQADGWTPTTFDKHNREGIVENII